MAKLWKQVVLNLIVFTLSLFTLWLSGVVREDRFITIEEFLTADFLFVLFSSLTGTQMSRYLDDIRGHWLWNMISGLVSVCFLIIYGVAIPLAAREYVTVLIAVAFWVFVCVILVEYVIIFIHTWSIDDSPNDMAATKRYKNSTHN